MSSLKQCQRGAVYLEFLLAFLPIFILFLGIVQLALVRGAQLVVREAAARACRSAIVILDDDPSKHSTERGLLHGSPPPPGFFARIGSFFGMGGAPDPGPDGSRLAAIRAAAYVPLTALSPPLSFQPEAASLSRALSSDAARFAAGFAGYNKAGAIVTLREEAGSEELATEPIAPDAQVTVHVTYLYACSVPLASALVCRTLPQLLGGGAVTDALQAARDNPLEIVEILQSLESDVEEAQALGRELSRAEMPALLTPYLLGGMRFAVLQAEITLPNQGARYHGGYGG